MDVAKPEEVGEPGYPDASHFLKSARHLGLAAVGAGVVAVGTAGLLEAGVGSDGTLASGGSTESRPVGVLGRIRVEPSPTATPPMIRPPGGIAAPPSPTPPKIGGVPVPPKK